MFNQLQHLGRGIPARAAAVVLACAVGAPAQAATYWWNTGNALWTANGSWAANADGSGAGSVPTSADTAIFSVTGSTAAVTGTLGIDAAVYGIRTLPGQLGLTLTAASARTLTIGAGGIESQGSSFVNTSNGRIALADSQVWSGNFGGLAGRVTLASSSNETLLMNSLGSGTFAAGIFDGAGGAKLSFWKAGSGTVVYNTTAPTYTGVLTLRDGLFYSGVNTALSTASKIQLAGGRLHVQNLSTNANGVEVIGGSSTLESLWFGNSQTFTRAKGGGVVSRASNTAGLGSADMVNGIIPWMSLTQNSNLNLGFGQVVNGTISRLDSTSLGGTGQQFNLNNVTGTTANYVFGSSGSTGSVTLSASRIVNSLNYQGSGTVDLAGFDLTLNAALVRDSSTSTSFTAQGSGRIVIGSSGELVFRGWNNSVVISSTIGETAAGGHLTLGAAVGSGTFAPPTGTFTLSGNNAHSGGTSLHGLRLNINNAGALGTGTFTLSGGSLDNTSGAAIVNANDNAQVWNVDLAFAGSNPLNLGTGAVSLGGWAGRTRTVTVTSSTLTVGGGIADGTHADLATIGLDKAGAGTLVLGGVNTYTGPTAVSAGSLLFNGRSTGGGAFSVAAAATLGGSGTIGGAVSVSGTLAPGDGTGVLTVGSVNLGSTSTTLLQISGTSRGSLYDAITATGGAGIGYGGALALVLTGTNYSGTFDLFNFASLASTGSFSSISATGDFGSFSFTPNASGTWTSAASGSRPEMTFSQTTGDLVIVPEPAALVIAGVGGLLLAWRLRRRRAAD
jgi:autotransporter-associated beta strand protein